MTTLDYLEKIDDILTGYEDWMHGQDGEDCTNARVYLDKVREQLNLGVVIVPKGTLPKDIEYISKESWELFDKHYDNETSNKHTKHWNFMEGIRVCLKNKK